MILLARKKLYIVFERVFMYSLAGLLFEQTPNHFPRNVANIMYKAREKFRENAFYDLEDYYNVIQDLTTFLENVLGDIPEFVDLNLSYEEIRKHINVNDDSRDSFLFTSLTDLKDKEKWKTDFLDTENFINCLAIEIQNNLHKDNDCAFCIHQDSQNGSLNPGNNETCRKCSINPNLTYNYQSSREPRNNFKITCKNDCHLLKYICCEECNEKDKCKYKCDSTSKECGQSIYKKNNFRR